MLGEGRVVVHRDEHRRHAVHPGAPLLGDRAQRDRRVEAGRGDHHGRAVRGAAEVGHHHPEAVVERHRDAQPVLRPEVDQLGRDVAVVEDVAVAERGALRVAGGPGGVLDVDRVVRLQRGHPLRERLGGDRRAAGDQLPPVVGVDVDDPLQGRALVAHLLDHAAVVAGLEARRGEQQPHPALVHRVGELVGAVRRVDVDQDRSGLGAGVLGQRPLRAVRGPDPDPLPLLHAGGHQPAGQGVDVAVQLGPGPAPAAGHLHQRLAVRVRRHGPREVGADGLLEQRRGGLALGVRQVRGIHGGKLRRPKGRAPRRATGEGCPGGALRRSSPPASPYRSP